MDLAARFTAYASDFERSHADRDWARLGPYFASAAVYECRAPEVLAFRVVGRAAILGRFETVTDAFDRGFDSRSISFAPPLVEGQRVSITGLVLYTLSGAPSFRLPFTESAEYRGAEIVHAFNFYGLLALGLPTRTLVTMPPEFIDGMAARAHILGDIQGRDASDCRDDIWRHSDSASKVHILVSLNARMHSDGTPIAELETATQWIFELCKASGGKVVVLPGNGPDKALYQDASALLSQRQDGTFEPTAKEHFGFTDGFGDPVFEGQYPADSEKSRAIGGGKILPDQSWAPLATGEFLLGYPDEAQEIPGGAMPAEFARNGTFIAYRKMVGRWSDGVPLLAAPTVQEYESFKAREAKAKADNDKEALAAIEQSYVNFQYRSRA